MISIRFFSLPGRSNRQARIFTRNTRAERNGPSNVEAVAETGRATGDHNHTTDVRARSLGGIFRAGTISLRKKSVPHCNRSRTWTCNFDPMNTESIR